MKNSNIIIAMIAVAAIAAAGIGYAVVYTGVADTSSHADFDQYMIEIDNSGGNQITAPITITQPTVTTDEDPVTHLADIAVTASTATSATYKIKVTCPDSSLYVRAKLQMEDLRSWAIINTITMTVGSTTYTWTCNGNNYQDVTKDLGSLSRGVSYDVSITVTYRECSFTDIYTEEEDLDFLDISGMKLILAASTHNPLTSS